MAFARFLGKINTFIFLTIFYFLIVGPIAIFLKLVKKDLLDIKISDQKESYWIKKDEPESTYYEHQF